jgi:hypothetical protein
MSWFLKLRKRRCLEHDFAEEFAFRRQMRAGAPEAPPFENEIRIRENMRDQWSFPWVETTL